VVRYLVLSFLLLSVALPLILLDPGMPAWGLDPSWVMASATAAAQRLSFGTQTIFTSGPYSPLYTQVYHPATYPLMLLASLYLALASAACIFLLAKDAQRRWMLLLAAAFLFAVGPPDALLFAFPLALGLVAVEVLGKDTPSGQSRWLQYLGVAALFGPLGLLPLVKGSLLVACAFTAIVACAVLAIRRQWGLSALCIASPTVGLLLFWVAIGQKLGGLPAYFSSMSQITAGYAEAMGLSPDPVARSLTGTLFWGYAEMFAFVAVSAFFVVVLARSKDRPLEWRVSASALVAVFLFLAFKAGFVRGGSHIAIATDCLLIAGALLPLLVRSRLSLVATALGVALYVLVTPHYMPASSFQPWKPFTSTLQGLAKAAKPGGLQTRYDDALAAIRANRPISHLNGTSDIYPYDQAELLASGNEWSPRPVLQSYSAYTPSLIELDRRHLLGASAPENLYLTTQAIDGRYPALDDGSSLPVILGSYSPIAAESYFLVTRRVAQPAENNTTVIGRQNGKLGQAVPVPPVDSPSSRRSTSSPRSSASCRQGSTCRARWRSP
jgi:hypothetical protein